VDNATVELPEVLVARQLEAMMDDYLRSLEARGVDVRAFVKANEENLQGLMQESRPQAENLVKTGLVLDAIAAEEQLEVSEDDIAAVIAPLATAGKVEPGVLREQLERSGRIRSIRQNLLRDKAADLVEGAAVPVEPTEPSEPAVSEGGEAEVAGAADDESAAVSPES